MPYEACFGMHDRSPTIFADTGCKLHHSCVTCPFPVCGHDERNLFLEFAAIKRGMPAVELTARGMTPEEVAEALGMSTRTVQRYLSRYADYVRKYNIKKEE